MKKRLLCALLCACLTLSGCTSMLSRDLVSITPHKSTTTDVGSSSALRVETYQELVNSLSYLISSGAAEGVIRLYMQTPQAEDDLSTARLEVLQEYPLAAYAVENITYETEPLLTYTEARVNISYRRTQQQIASIVPVTGISAVRATLTGAMSQFSPECVLRITFFDQTEDYVQDLIQQLYYANPDMALEFPELDVSIYPNSGKQRIVEVDFHYETDTPLLTERALLLKQACQRIADTLTAEGSATPVSAANAVLDAGGYRASGGSTGFSALLEGGANAEGLALAYASVCGNLGISCKVARGLYLGQPHFWNVVSTENGWRHLDLSRQDALPFSTDDLWGQDGYLWLENSLPSCS